MEAGEPVFLLRGRNYGGGVGGGVGWVGWDCGVLDFPESLPRLQTESGLEVRRLNSSRGQIIDLGQPHFSPDSKTSSHEAKKGSPSTPTTPDDEEEEASRTRDRKAR